MSDDIRAEAGFLILADISGFTAFVAGTELEHGALVTGVLLEAVMRRLSPPLEIQELEGDAVFAIGADGALPDGSVLDRKSTRLNSSHLGISYAVFCLKK